MEKNYIENVGDNTKIISGIFNNSITDDDNIINLNLKDDVTIGDNSNTGSINTLQNNDNTVNSEPNNAAIIENSNITNLIEPIKNIVSINTIYLEYNNIKKKLYDVYAAYIRNKKTKSSTNSRNYTVPAFISNTNVVILLEQLEQLEKLNLMLSNNDLLNTLVDDRKNLKLFILLTYDIYTIIEILKYINTNLPKENSFDVYKKILKKITDLDIISKITNLRETILKKMFNAEYSYNIEFLNIEYNNIITILDNFNTNTDNYDPNNTLLDQNKIIELFKSIIKIYPELFYKLQYLNYNVINRKKPLDTFQIKKYEDYMYGLYNGAIMFHTKINNIVTNMENFIKIPNTEYISTYIFIKEKLSILNKYFKEYTSPDIFKIETSLFDAVNKRNIDYIGGMLKNI